MNQNMELLKWLEQISSRIKKIESEALEALNRGEVGAYKRGMKDKAELLAGLAKEAEPHLEGVSKEIAGHVRSELERFSHSAGVALELDSVFYMSALLYPEEHRPGEPNNFELFAAEVAAKTD